MAVSDPDQSPPGAVDKRESRKALAPKPGEYYTDGPYLVFTEAYHVRRGYCCESGCRHCPYGFSKPEVAGA